MQPSLAFLRWLQYITLANSIQRRLAYLDPGGRGNVKCFLHFNRTRKDSTDYVGMHCVLKPTHHAKIIAAALTILLKSIDCCFRCLFPNLLYQITFEEAQRFHITDGGPGTVSLVFCTQGKCDLASWMQCVDPFCWSIWSAVTVAGLHNPGRGCERTGSALFAEQELGGEGA